MSMKRWAAALVLCAAALGGAPAGAQTPPKKINIGWTAWSDAEAVTKLAQKVVKDRLGYDGELTLADIGIQ